MLNTLTAIAVAAATTLAASAETVRHDFNLIFRYTDGTAPVVDFSLQLSSVQDVRFVEVEVFEGDDLVALANSPLYEEASPAANNPLYEGIAPPGGPDWIESIQIDVAALKTSSIEGIIHRDLATRNVLINTASGLFSIGTDLAGADLFQADGNVGPIRWLAPESITTRQYDGRLPNDPQLTLLAGSSFTTTIIPAPATAAPFLALTLANRRRRRNA